MKFMMKRLMSALLCVVLLLSLIGSVLAGEVKWTEELTADGWMKVTQEGGPTLGYSPNTGVTILTVDGFAFKDLNKNGKLDAYEDWRLDAQTRSEELASLMTPEEQLPLMFLNRYDSDYKPGKRTEYLIGLLDQGIRSLATPRGANNMAQYMWYINDMQAYVEALPYGIPMEQCGEAGNALASSWPNNLSLAATFDPNIAAQRALAMSEEYRAIGITGMMTPQIDLATEPRWSRITGTFGEDPALSRDMAVAYDNAMQSTYDEEGNDLGWGMKSLNSQLKHFPGDGPGESGRESHNAYGAYAVYPGDNLFAHLIPFKGCLNLPGKTGAASGVMPSYSIAIDEDGNPYDDVQLASAYSYFKLTEILREEMGFDGVISSDFIIAEGLPGTNPREWGVEDLTIPERRLLAIEAGLDRFGGEAFPETLLEAYKLGVEKHGEEWMANRINESAVRLLRNMFQVGLFELPYVSTEYAKSVVNTDEKNAAGYDALTKTVAMLKNSGNIIHEATTDADKPTVYLPMIYANGAWSYGIDTKVALKYFNIVTDKVSTTLTGALDKDGKPTVSEADIIRASDEEISSCDFALVCITSPKNGRGYDSETNTYFPISLQYGDYTADSLYVRQTSLGGRIVEVTVDSPYGAQTIYEPENRSYYGNSAQISNKNHLDTVLFAADRADKVIVSITASNPMIFSEFEDKVDAILMNFGQSGEQVAKVICEIITGKLEPSALLPIQMPANMETVEAQYEDVPRDMECHVDTDGNTYDFAFGLNWSGVIKDERVAKYSIAPLTE